MYNIINDSNINDSDINDSNINDSNINDVENAAKSNLLSTIRLSSEIIIKTGVTPSMRMLEKTKIEYAIPSKMFCEYINTIVRIAAKLCNKSVKKFIELLRTSALRKLAVDGSEFGDIPSADAIRAVVDILYEIYHSRQKTEFIDILGINIFKPSKDNTTNDDEKKVQISVNNGILGLSTYHYGYLCALFPYAKSNVERCQLAVSAVVLILERMRKKNKEPQQVSDADNTTENIDDNATENTTKKKNSSRKKTSSTHDKNVKPVISSYGSKNTFATQYFNPEGFDIADDMNICEVFSRTMIISLLHMKSFDNVYCYDKDGAFINFFYVVEHHLDALIASVKRRLLAYGLLKTDLRVREKDIEKKLLKTKTQAINDDAYAKEKIKCIIRHARVSVGVEELYRLGGGAIVSAFGLNRRKLNSIPKEPVRANKYSSLSTYEKISKAADLLLLVNFTHSGNMKEINYQKAKAFINNFETTEKNMRYISKLLNDNSEKVMINRANFMSTIKKYKYREDVILIIDSPYVRLFGIQCGDYKDAFTWKNIADMLKELSDVKCKVVMTHSDNLEFEAAALHYGFTKVGYYTSPGFPKKGYITNVYTLNVSDDEAKKVFKNLPAA